MTQTEKDQKLAAITADIENYENTVAALKSAREVLKSAPVTPQFKVWEPETGDRYYDSGSMTISRLNESKESTRLVQSGFAHQTESSAERHHSFLVMLHDLHKFAVEENAGWKPDAQNGISYYIHKRTFHELGVEKNRFSQFSILPYFKSEELAQKAIDTFGDRLKILFEYYNS